MCYNANMKKFMVNQWLYDTKQQEIFKIKFRGKTGTRPLNFEKNEDGDCAIYGEIVKETDNAIKIGTKALSVAGDERIAEIWLPKSQVSAIYDV